MPMAFFFLLLFHIVSSAADSIDQSQTISDGSTTLVSNSGNFELGFFSPVDSRSRYVGIWYKRIPVLPPVWVLNRCNPINDSSGLLMINNVGDLVLLYQNKSVLWSTRPSMQAQKPIVELLDSGNLVLRNENDTDPENYLWQSFDYPSDTLLPGMKMGWDLRTGLKRSLSAWKSKDDPCPGDFTYGIEFGPQLYTFPQDCMRKGTVKLYRGGSWNGIPLTSSPKLRSNPIYDFDFVYNDDEIYYIYNKKDKSLLFRTTMNPRRLTLQTWTWNEADQNWMLYTSVPANQCDNYGLCGTNGICNIDANPFCQCLVGFKPKSPRKWDLMDWSDGCVRKTPLNCLETDKGGFVEVSGLKVPDTTHSRMFENLSPQECQVICINNCSCMAYGNGDFRGNGTNGCFMWYGDLIDISTIQTGGQDLFIRLSLQEIGMSLILSHNITIYLQLCHDFYLNILSSPRKSMIYLLAVIHFSFFLGLAKLNRRGLAKLNRRKHYNKVRAVIVVPSVIGGVSGMLLLGYCICRKRSKDTNKNRAKVEDFELPLFSLAAVSIATNNFSANNKLGEGGFGPVYRGKLEDGQEIAVKRLSLSSRQGVDEFKNELILIAKLQHRNLVKLLGCCIQGDEKLLIYECMPNKSLDLFIFDQQQSTLLEWPKRFEIICGIARGLQYLHQDSRLRIVHRDLKASNILLDNMMNPKISDFGLAKTFGGDQTEGNTNRIAGTHGYMAPEYAFNGLFSTKSDVFSFGIMVLEIISGKRSIRFHHENRNLTLIGYAWTLLNEERPFELIDVCLRDSYDNLPQVLRCIHVGLLCVQQHPMDRPRMSSVVLMLGSESELPHPKPPGYFMEIDSQERDYVPNKPESSSKNTMTLTALGGR